jgi:hypothetical protein
MRAMFDCFMNLIIKECEPAGGVEVPVKRYKGAGAPQPAIRGAKQPEILAVGYPL